MTGKNAINRNTSNAPTTLNEVPATSTTKQIPTEQSIHDYILTNYSSEVRPDDDQMRPIVHFQIKVSKLNKLVSGDVCLLNTLNKLKWLQFQTIRIFMSIL